MQTPDPSIVSPGVEGFVIMFVLALATVVLMRSMVGHLRKVRYGPGPPEEKTDDRPADGDDQAAG
jgi:hypothetical protein